MTEGTPRDRNDGLKIGNTREETTKKNILKEGDKSYGQASR